MHLPSKLALVGVAAGWLLAAGAAESGLAARQRLAESPFDWQTLAVRHALREAAITKRDTQYRNSTSISKSFDTVTLFDGTIDVEFPTSVAVDVAVVCLSCYVQGSATAEFSVAGTFNASQAVSSAAESLADDVQNITTKVVDDISATLVNDTAATLQLNFPAMEMPTIDLDFGLDVESIPECQLAFTFDTLEMFVQTQTNVSGAVTYSLNLFTSESELGIRVSDTLQIGVILTVDLIMSIDEAVELESGFHVKLDDGLVLTVDFFGNNVTDLTFNGGTFEFLPITTDAEATINSILRVGVHAGVAVTPDPVQFLGVDFPYSAGVGSVVFADVANFTTTITTSSNISADSDLGADLDDCDLAAEEIYEFGIGAGAGASLVIDGHSWGIGPTTVLPVWFTTLAQCVTSTSFSRSATTATATATAVDTAILTATSIPLARRDNVSVTSTISTTFTHSAIGCLSVSLPNCPVSLQTTAITTTESTTVMVVSPGANATWPASTATTVTSVSFGSDAKPMKLYVSGTPSSYVSTATASSGSSGSSDSSSGHNGLTSHEKNIVIGVTVGVGVPLVAGILTGIIILRKRRNAPSSGEAAGTK